MVVTTRKYNPGFLSDEELVASFCVRTMEFESLVEVLRQCTGSSNQHQIVIGPRGSGKTTLLLRVAAEVRRNPALAPHCFPIVFAEESYEVATAGEFWLECLTLLAAQAPDREDGPDLYRTVDELRRAISDDRTLGDRCLGALLDFADRYDQRLLLLVENLNMLFRDMADPDAGWRLRKILQMEPRIIMFASATSRFDEIDHPDHALYELFRVRTLRPLNTRACETLWHMVTSRPVARETIRSLEILTGGSPRLLTVLARFGAARSFHKLMADLFDLVDDHTEYFKSHLESLAAQERRIYLALATLWKPATTREIAAQARLDTSTCSAQLARLCDRGAVHVIGGSARRKQYYLTERLYNIYYLLRRHREPDHMVEALIRFMECYYSPQELKEIAVYEMERPGDDDNSGLMRPVYQRAFDQLLASSVLAQYREDLEAMRPDMTADSDPSEQSGSQLWMKVETLVAGNRLEDALAICDKILRRFEGSGHSANEPMIAGALARRTGVLGRLKRPQDALAVCDEVVARFGESETPAILEAVAIALVNKQAALNMLNRPQDALAVCDEVVAHFGKSGTTDALGTVVTTLVNKGFALTALNRPQDALAAYDEAIAHFKESETPDLFEAVAMALAHKGRVLGELDRTQDALEVYDQVVARFGASKACTVLWSVAMALVNKGGALVKLGRPQDAVEVFDHVVARFGNGETPDMLIEAVAMALTNKASMLSKPQDMLAAYNQVVERFGNRETPGTIGSVARALMNKGSVLIDLNRPQEALAACDQVVTRFENTQTPAILRSVAGALVNKGVALNALNRPQEALAACNEVVARFGDSDAPGAQEVVSTALVLKGGLLRKWDRPQVALEVYGQVVARFGASTRPAIFESVARALTTMAGVLIDLNRPQEALTACDQVVERFGRSEIPAILELVARALWNKGVALNALNQPEEALAAYDDVVGRFGTSNVPTLRAGVFIAQALFARATATLVERDLQDGLTLLSKGNFLSPESIKALIELSVQIGPQRMGELIQQSPSAHLLLPLTTALERELGKAPRVAQEVDEVAQDIQRQLKGLRKDKGGWQRGNGN